MAVSFKDLSDAFNAARQEHHAKMEEAIYKAHSELNTQEVQGIWQTIIPSTQSWWRGDIVLEPRKSNPVEDDIQDVDFSE